MAEINPEGISGRISAPNASNRILEANPGLPADRTVTPMETVEFWEAAFATTTDLRETVFLALGAASASWSNLGEAGTFLSERAAAIGAAAVKRIEELQATTQP